MSRLITAMRAAQILRDARDFLSDRNHWVKGALFASSKQEDGDAASGPWSNAANAPMACSLGAIARSMRVQRGNHYWIQKPEAGAALVALAQAVSDESRESIPASTESIATSVIVSFNDRNKTTHEQVLAAFDTAITTICAAVQKEEANDTKDQAE